MKKFSLFIIWICGLSIPTLAQSDVEAIVLLPDYLFDGSELTEGGAVFITDNRISNVEFGEIRSSFLSSRVIRLPGMTLMPGMIEGHSHILLHPYNETSWNDQVLKESLGERAIRATNHARASLNAGITTMRDLGSEGAGFLDVQVKQSIDKGLIKGPRLIVAGPAIVATGSYGPKGFASHVDVPLGAAEADGVDGLIAEVRRQIGGGADLIKVYADYRWGPDGTAQPTFSIEELKLIVNTAKSSGRDVVAHAATAEGMRRAAIAGVATIEHGDGGTEDVFKLMKEHNVALCPTLAAGDAIMQYRGWDKSKEPEPQRIKQKKKSFSIALQVGVPIVAGGDVGVYSHGDNVREFELMEEYGMSKIDVLKNITSINARLLKLQDLGEIKKGYLADLIAVEGNPLSDLSHLRKVKLVMKEGKIVFNQFD